MQTLENKKSIKNLIKNNSLNIICSVENINNIENNLDKNITAVVSDTEININIPVIKTGTVYTSLLNEEQINCDAVLLNVSEYSKKELIEISEFYNNKNIELLFKVKDLFDVAKVRQLKPELIILGSDVYSAGAVHPVILNSLIDWECAILLNKGNSNAGLSLAHEYGFKGLYTDEDITAVNADVNIDFEHTLFLEKLYSRRSSVRPLIKAGGLKNKADIIECINNGADIVGINVTLSNISNISDLLKELKVINNKTVIVLEISDNDILLDKSAVNLVISGLADGIEHKSNGSLVNSYKNVLDMSDISEKNSLVPVMYSGSINDLWDKDIENLRLWLSASEAEDINKIVRIFNPELINLDYDKILINKRNDLMGFFRSIKYKK